MVPHDRPDVSQPLIERWVDSTLGQRDRMAAAAAEAAAAARGAAAASAAAGATASSGGAAPVWSGELEGIAAV
jgi:hypothetical protein